MKTKDVLSFGIDRNFLRKCIDAKVITPKELDNEWIINKEYVPYDYSQEDVETVWNAYLCRKMGLSYDEIKLLNKGQEIGIHNSLNELIQKFENQIAELKVLIEFMKYVKGIGVVPTPPTQLMGSTDFKEYLTDFIDYLDKDKKLKKVLNLTEYISEIDDMETAESADFDNMESMYEALDSEISSEVRDSYAYAFSELSNKTHLNPACNEVQDIIQQIFNCEKELRNNKALTAWEFAGNYVFLLSYESDISGAYTKILGEKAIKFFISALVEFLAIHEPDRIEQIRKAHKNIINK